MYQLVVGSKFTAETETRELVVLEKLELVEKVMPTMLIIMKISDVFLLMEFEEFKVNQLK